MMADANQRATKRRVSGDGALGVWHDVVIEQQDGIEDWYNREHHAERVAIDGFLRARRYRNVGSGHSYFSRYDTVTSAVLGSAAYLHALDHPSPWSTSIFPHYRNTVRGAFTVIGATGDAEGGVLVSVRFAAMPALDLRALTHRIAVQRGVVGVEAWTIDVAATTPPTTERRIRGGDENFPVAALMIDASRADWAEGALSAAAGGLGDGVTVERYRLVFQKFAAGTAVARDL